MGWGTELWDQYENLATHTQKGIDFLDKYGNFIRDRSAIEVEYAARLRWIFFKRVYDEDLWFKPKADRLRSFQFDKGLLWNDGIQTTLNIFLGSSLEVT